MKRIFVFGNEYIKIDSLAKEIADSIQINNIQLIDCKSPNDMFNTGEENPIILDVVENIHEVKIIKINDIKETPSSTAHDMDLAFMLKLYKELGMIKDATIIGVPMNADKNKIIKEVKDILKDL